MGTAERWVSLPRFPFRSTTICPSLLLHISVFPQMGQPLSCGRASAGHSSGHRPWSSLSWPFVAASTVALLRYPGLSLTCLCPPRTYTPCFQHLSWPVLFESKQGCHVECLCPFYLSISWFLLLAHTWQCSGFTSRSLHRGPSMISCMQDRCPTLCPTAAVLPPPFLPPGFTEPPSPAAPFPCEADLLQGHLLREFPTAARTPELFDPPVISGPACSTRFPWAGCWLFIERAFV